MKHTEIPRSGAALVLAGLVPLAMALAGEVAFAPATEAVAAAQAAQAAQVAQAAQAAQAAQFDPLSVTFVSLETGWALGTVPCKASVACLALEKTTNAGASWAPAALPSGLLAQVDRKVNGRSALLPLGEASLVNIRFADTLDGWVYADLPAANASQAVLWSTHDGGRTWHQLHPFATADALFPYFDLEAMAGNVYLMGVNTNFGVTVESSPVSRDAWHADKTPKLSLPAGGAEPSGSFIFQDGRGWLVEGNDRGISGSAQLVGPGEWEAWEPPCGDVGNSYTVPAASNASDLVAICTMGGFASPLSKSAPPGAKIGSTWLYVSVNGGASFQAVAQLSSHFGQPFFDGALASPSPGVILAERSSSIEQLVASFDGARHWSVVYNGSLFYLGFTSPAQGVGLVTTSTTETSIKTAMIMSFDGGHSWSRVNF